MQWLIYTRLVILTIGTLLPFFWMIVILGHRRQRNFERVFFFLCLALTMFFGCSLLALNAQLNYGAIPEALERIVWGIATVGLWFVPPLVIHTHLEYASLRELLGSRPPKLGVTLLGYLPAALLAPALYSAWIAPAGQIDFERPTHVFGLAYQAYLVVSLLFAGYWQWRFAGTAPDRQQRAFHDVLKFNILGMAVLLAVIFSVQRVSGPEATAGFNNVAYLLALIPLGLLISNVQRFNFLQMGRQRNLIYAVSIVFLALLYLSLVRRASQWLAAYLPPEATSALLLFLPVVFFEPLQRWMRGILRQTAQTEVDRAQRLMAPINESARLGDREQLRVFTENWIAEQLQLAETHLSLGDEGAIRWQRGERSSEEAFEIRSGGERMGMLRARSHGAMVSGETYAALEFVAEQLPSAFELCRLIEEKLQLERELAERERLALVGQMAASISHNLKNPLGSIKTILQVQMESPELPASLRKETQMVLEEVNRLSAKLNQLLQFSRPSRSGPTDEATCDIRVVVEEVLNVLRPEAQRRRVRLGYRMAEGDSRVDASAEALHDIVSNLVVNAIDASPVDGEVKVELSWLGLPCVLSVEDEGSGIPAELQEKILQPFFTTKPQGTGLGLAVVGKRLAEIGGELRVVSPTKARGGTRFEVTLWPAFFRRNRALSLQKAQER